MKHETFLGNVDNKKEASLIQSVDASFDVVKYAK